MLDWAHSSRDDALAAGSLLAVLASLLSFFLAGVLTAVAYLAHLRRTFKVPTLRRAVLCLVVACNVQVILGFGVIARPFFAPSFALARSQVWPAAFSALGLAARLIVVACARAYLRLPLRSWISGLLLVGEQAAYIDPALLPHQSSLAARCWCSVCIALSYMLAASAPILVSSTSDADKSAEDNSVAPLFRSRRARLSCALATACIVLIRWRAGAGFTLGWNLLWSNVTALGLVVSLIDQRKSRTHRTSRRAHSDSSSGRSSSTVDGSSCLYGTAETGPASNKPSATTVSFPSEVGPASPAAASNSGSGATEASGAGLSAFRGSSERSDLHRPDGSSLTPSLNGATVRHVNPASSRTIPHRLAPPSGALRWKVDTSPLCTPATPSSDCLKNAQQLPPTSPDALDSVGEDHEATSESSFYCRGEIESETMVQQQVPGSPPITEQSGSSAGRSDDALAALPRQVDSLGAPSVARSSGASLPGRPTSAPPSAVGSATFAGRLYAGLGSDAGLREHLSRLTQGAAQIAIGPGMRSLHKSEFQAGIDEREVSFDKHGGDGPSFGLPRHRDSADGSALGLPAVHRAERWVVHINAADQERNSDPRFAAIAFAHARSGQPANPLVDVRASALKEGPKSEPCAPA